MPKLLCDTAGMTRERWLDCRMHGPDGKIPYTLGGSDVAAVFGVSPWITPPELWRIKKGLMQPDDSTNIAAKEMGNLMEPIVAQCYAKATSNTIIPDTSLYQHTSRPYALANLDFR
ncbi:MAG: YqaJ viral recombinase family protein, partial [Oscillospiraceae bacterium]|nr:YqaJ viral recombinase family protein [Oscillospiraceae bacterium]